jgi:predicted  nucleic acid-binding Zn-ribbon protein
MTATQIRQELDDLRTRLTQAERSREALDNTILDLEKQIERKEYELACINEEE